MYNQQLLRNILIQGQEGDPDNTKMSERVFSKELSYTSLKMFLLYSKILFQV